jgi:hypothetical protein
MHGRSVCRVLVGRPKVKRSLGRPGHRWEAKIKLDLMEIESSGGLFVNMVMNPRIP